MSKKYLIVKNLNNSYSVKFFSGKFYKVWNNPITGKPLIFADQEIAKYWAELPNPPYQYLVDNNIKTIDFYC